MLCDSCLKELAVDLSRESQMVLASLQGKRLNKSQVQVRSKLSYAITMRAISELQSCKLVSYSEFGRSKVYQLTKNGERLLQLYREVKAC